MHPHRYGELRGAFSYHRIKRYHPGTMPQAGNFSEEGAPSVLAATPGKEAAALIFAGNVDV
jgi:hypothetical protein